jgi:hypothetical protein
MDELNNFWLAGIQANNGQHVQVDDPSAPGGKRLVHASKAEECRANVYGEPLRFWLPDEDDSANAHGEQYGIPDEYSSRNAHEAQSEDGTPWVDWPNQVQGVYSSSRLLFQQQPCTVGFFQGLQQPLWPQQFPSYVPASHMWSPYAVPATATLAAPMPATRRWKAENKRYCPHKTGPSQDPDRQLRNAPLLVAPVHAANPQRHRRPHKKSAISSEANRC